MTNDIAQHFLSSHAKVLHLAPNRRRHCTQQQILLISSIRRQLIVTLNVCAVRRQVGEDYTGVDAAVSPISNTHAAKRRRWCKSVRPTPRQHPCALKRRTCTNISTEFVDNRACMVLAHSALTIGCGVVSFWTGACTETHS